METPGTKRDETYRDLKPATGERRRRVRHKVHTPAYASLNGNSTGMVLDLSEILDISEDGASIQALPPPALQQDISLCLDLSETKGFIYTTGHVVWSDRSGRTGIRFPEMAESSRRQLKEWLFQAAPPGTFGLPPVPGTVQTPTTEQQRTGYIDVDLLSLAEWAVENAKAVVKDRPLEVATVATGGMYQSTFRDRSIEDVVDAI